MKYHIFLKPAAKNQLKKLRKKDLHRVNHLIDSLSENPRPSNCRKLHEIKGLYRIKSGDIRIIYTIEDDILIVVIVKIGKRNEIYRRLPRI